MKKNNTTSRTFTISRHTAVERERQQTKKVATRGTHTIIYIVYYDITTTIYNTTIILDTKWYMKFFVVFSARFLDTIFGVY